jgi:uncharacterized protein (TIGR02466 family)
MEKLHEASYFATKIYAIKKPEFLEAVKAVSERYLKDAHERLGEGQHMTVMTATYAHEESIKDFAEYVSQTAWNILHSQGYAVDQLVTFFTEMWTQEHNAFSDMAYHVHNMGAQISAFYFLDVPQGACQMIIHDPRPTKMMITMPAADDKKVTDATPHVVFTPEPGTLILTNSWLPHSFTKNMSLEPTRFVHMNLSVMVAPETRDPNVEVV